MSKAPLALLLLAACHGASPLPDAGGQVFDSGAVVPGDAGPGPALCGACANGTQCDAETGQCVPDCRVQGGCTSPAVCDANTGSCMADGGVTLPPDDAGGAIADGGAGDCHDAGCPAAQPYCDASSGLCLQCRSPSDCPPGEGCNTLTGGCGSCIQQADCGDAGTVCDLATFVCRAACGDAGNGACPASNPLCDPSTGLCEQCRTSAQCDGGACGLDLRCE